MNHPIKVADFVHQETGDGDDDDYAGEQFFDTSSNEGMLTQRSSHRQGNKVLATQMYNTIGASDSVFS